ncbi:centromere protein P isoform X2 [Ahaetulla prasina]|uniref:centromere protein P isoform X2 n=1 Tax=Ahaetulla prasina TaxID=499056 RepID=UPI002649900F|nr:centromere protein P isoform X2 [Ahaetulla prasina]
MNSNELQACEDEIKSLEEEIKLLTEEYEHSQHQSMAYTEAEIMEIMKLLRKKPEEKLKQSKFPDQETELHLLEADLSFIMKFTGLSFTNYSRKPVEKNGSKTIQIYKLSGKCQSISFLLEFKLTEENQMNRNASAIVTDLNIITECDMPCDLSNLVSRVEENGNLCLFFRSLTCFSEWCKHRERTFAHFKVGVSSSGPYRSTFSRMMWTFKPFKGASMAAVIKSICLIPLVFPSIFPRVAASQESWVFA